jgi:hypothetical protein
MQSSSITTNDSTDSISSSALTPNAKSSSYSHCYTSSTASSPNLSGFANLDMLSEAASRSVSVGSPASERVVVPPPESGENLHSTKDAFTDTLKGSPRNRQYTTSRTNESSHGSLLQSTTVIKKLLEDLEESLQVLGRPHQNSHPHPHPPSKLTNLFQNHRHRNQPYTQQVLERQQDRHRLHHLNNPSALQSDGRPASAQPLHDLTALISTCNSLNVTASLTLSMVSYMEVQSALLNRNVVDARKYHQRENLRGMRRLGNFDF